MTVSPTRAAGAAAGAAIFLAAAPGTASADFSDPWPTISSTSVHIASGDGGPFFLREPGADSPDVNLVGTVTGTNVSDDWRSEMCLVWYGSFDDNGVPDRQTITCDLSVRPDGTVRNLDDITLNLDGSGDESVEVTDAFVAGLYLIPEEDNPQTLQNETMPLINPAVASLPVAKAEAPGFNGQLVGLGILDKGTLPEQQMLTTGAADPWTALNPLDLVGAQGLLSAILDGTPGLPANTPLHVPDLMNFEVQTMNADGGYILKGLGGNSASNFVMSNGSGIIGNGILSGSMGLQLQRTVFDGMARLDRHTATNTQQVRVPDILVDGKWIGYSVGEQAELGAANLPLDGFSPLTIVDSPVGRALDPGSGNLTLMSRDPIALCVDDDNDPEGDGDYDPGTVGETEPVCDHWKSAGFAIERTYELDGPAVKVTDAIVSTGAAKAATTIQLSYENAIDDAVTGQDLDPRFGIGNGSLRQYEGLEQLVFSGPNTSLVIDGDEQDASGDDDSAAGLHTFNTKPNRVYFLDETSAENAEDYVAEYTVAPGSSVVQTFTQLRSIEDVDDLAADAEDAPAPAAASTTQSSQSVAQVVQTTVEKFVETTPGATAKTPSGATITAPAAVQSQAASAGTVAAQSRAAAPARTCLVPRLRGRTRLGAERAIVRAGCSIGLVTIQRSKKIKKGRVISQSRAAGRVLPGGTAVKLRVSRGRR